MNIIGESARSMGLDAEGHIRAETFRVVCVEETRAVIGDADGTGPLELHLLNEGFRHYVPLLRRRAVHYPGVILESSTHAL